MYCTFKLRPYHLYVGTDTLWWLTCESPANQYHCILIKTKNYSNQYTLLVTPSHTKDRNVFAHN